MIVTEMFVIETLKGVKLSRKSKYQIFETSKM